jgi:hypothetical protein
MRVTRQRFNNDDLEQKIQQQNTQYTTLHNDGNESGTQINNSLNIA